MLAHFGREIGSLIRLLGAMKDHAPRARERTSSHNGAEADDRGPALEVAPISGRDMRLSAIDCPLLRREAGL